MSPAEKKRLLRAEALERLRKLSANYVQACSDKLRRLLTDELHGARHICLYAPLPHEVNLMPLLIEQRGCAYYFPRCLPGRELSFHRVQDAASELAPGAMGIPAPLPHLPQITPAEAELIIVPGVAFTRKGKRLGYGGGYYDRYLPRLSPHARTLALALPEQMYDDLPTEAYDIPIDRVLTLDRPLS